MKIRLFAPAALVGAISAASPALALTNITNGDFAANSGNGQVSYNTTVAGWSVVPPGCATTCPQAGTQSYVFVFNPGPGASGSTADTTGAPGFYGPALRLYGPGNTPPTNNGFTVDNLPGAGGALLANSPEFQNAAIQATATGLIAGQTYEVSFDWAAAQQQGFDGTTTEGWKVTLGGASESTSIITLPDKGFSGWNTQSFMFTADGASDQLSFLAIGAPGTPDHQGFALLSSVRMAPNPEPATWSLMVVGVGALGAALRMRRRTIFAV